MFCELVTDCYALLLEFKFRYDCNCDVQFACTNAGPS